MFIKCLLFLFIFANIEAQYGSRTEPRRNFRPCPYPRLDHGRVRLRNRSKLVKFICFPGFELVGNKYATCRDGEWDVPTPVCVKPGCNISHLDNGVVMPSRMGAWVVFFCLPGHQLVGSSALYCDGRKWNGTAPACVDSTAPRKLSCDFEESNICGWTQDELHDFDWKRLNKKTPSSFLFTGPSFDHTFGKEGTGYYMYIESTSRLENDTARLISPIYDKDLVDNGCFSFYYHMFGKTTGGLRVYQKPDSLPLRSLLELQGTDRHRYLLFEMWGNQGDDWHRAAPYLSNFSDNFQIVIEGIRGSSFTSDIAIDDVAILEGRNCTIEAPSTPTNMPDSCVGRCDLFGTPADELGCGCTAACLRDSTCCPDFFEMCVFENTASADETSEPAELPQTQKLVASTISADSTTTTTTTPKPTTTRSRSTVSTTTVKTTVPPTKATTKPTTTRQLITTIKPKTSTKPTSTAKTTLINTASRKHETIKPIKMPPTTIKMTTKVVSSTTVKTESYFDGKKKQKKLEMVEDKKVDPTRSSSREIKNQSSGLRTAMTIIIVLVSCAGVCWLAVTARSARGRAALATLRGRARSDPEVRYLNADVDDD